MATKYAFIAEWLDPGTGYLWKYQLFFYAETNEVEMVRCRLLSTHHAARRRRPAPRAAAAGLSPAARPFRAQRVCV